MADDRIDVRITVDASQAKAGFKEVEDSAAKMADQVSAAGAHAAAGMKPLEITPRISAPITVPVMRPMPPARLVPPITAAAIASSSYERPMPDWLVCARAETTTPASPLSKPAIA